MLQRLPNPDNVPGAVSSGYQRQNTNMFALQTGLDTTEPYDNGEGVITIPLGGIVDLNGVMYKIAADITVQKPNADTAYWLAVMTNGDGTASVQPVTRPGAWNSAKQGCYLADGRRTLNWVSLGELADAPTVGAEWISPRVSGSYFKQFKKGWKYVRMASGLGGGDGADGSGLIGGAGGVAIKKNTINRLIFVHGDKNYLIKVGADGKSGSNGNTTAGGGGGGGGGSGGGDETLFDDLLRANAVPPGIGGKGADGRIDGNLLYYGNGGSPGSNGDTLPVSGGGVARGGRSGIIGQGQGGGGGGGGGSGSSNGAYGGNGGDDGSVMPDGSPGGYCDIYSIEN